MTADWRRLVTISTSNGATARKPWATDMNDWLEPVARIERARLASLAQAANGAHHVVDIDVIARLLTLAKQAHDVVGGGGAGEAVGSVAVVGVARPIHGRRSNHH